MTHSAMVESMTRKTTQMWSSISLSSTRADRLKNKFLAMPKKTTEWLGEQGGRANMTVTNGNKRRGGG